MKVYDITEPTAERKSNDSVWYRNKICYFVQLYWSFSCAWLPV